MTASKANSRKHLVQTDVTQILQAWGEGDKGAPERLMPLVYQELRRLAQEYLRRERPDHTLQATALVHEAYIKLVDQDRVDWKGRAHFCGVAAQLMRRVLLEHARSHNAGKRGGKLKKLYLDETRELSQQRPPDLIALDDALQSFSRTFPRESEVVELKFFGGLGAEEIAELLQVSTKTVLRDWKFAKLWLCRELSGSSPN
jgi:RNA polymerase sigma factor (TIGR02999 family)